MSEQDHWAREGGTIEDTVNRASLLEITTYIILHSVN